MTTLQQSSPQASPASAPTSAKPVNVSGRERILSGVLGGAAIYTGLKLRSIPGLLVAGLGAALIHRGYTGHCHGYTLLGINTARKPAAQPHEFFEHGIHVEKSVTVNRSPRELYEFWRRFENLPRFMTHLKAVQVIDNNRSHWVAKAPAGSVEWVATIINEEPDTLIAWRSLEGADVNHAGSVRFIPAPAGRGTEVRVVLEYLPPAGRLGAAVATLFGEEPSQQIQEDLRRFKRVMEAGEVPSTEGQPQGTCI